MGRVRRYKKFKAIDPFAKAKKAEVDLVHDEPPDVHDERGRKRRRQLEEVDEDVMLRREGMRALREEKARQSKVADRKVEGKAEDETMKDFKIRMRNETRKVLHDELKSMTATAQKRKMRLKDRKAKRKTKGSGKAEEAPDFFMAENGRIRPSDMGGPEDFKQLDKVRFGETAERPPDLSAFTGRKARQQAVVHPLYTGGEQSAQSAGSKFIERQKMRETREQFLAKEAEAKPVMKNGSLSLKELVRAQEAARQAYAALRQKRLQGAAK